MLIAADRADGRLVGRSVDVQLWFIDQKQKWTTIFIFGRPNEWAEPNDMNDDNDLADL